MRLILPISLILVSLLLGACGQRGPLYLPDDVIKAHEAELAAERAAEQAEAEARLAAEPQPDSAANP
ncbi:MAG: lipoprotein [Gammaproteobacteria bacterium]|nr:lipoprotein [Gammaproteobacteria bacterium]